MTDKEFKTTKKQMKEFMACSNAADLVLSGLNPLLRNIGDSRIKSRLTAIMKQIQISDKDGANGS